MARLLCEAKGNKCIGVERQEGRDWGQGFGIVRLPASFIEKTSTQHRFKKVLCSVSIQTEVMNLSRQWWRSKTFISNRCVRYLQLLILKTLNYAQRRDRDDVINKHLTSIIHSESFLPSLNSRAIWHEFDPRPLLERSFASKTTTAERTSNLHIKERKTVFLHAENKRFSFSVQFSQPFLVLSTTSSVQQLCGRRKRLTTTNITKALIQIIF